jgi:hypothetical protein
MEDMIKDMDFSLVCSQIQELLIVNEEVVLPGLGKFTVESIPASFKEDGMSILPPGKKLSFVQDSAQVECEGWQKDLSGKILENLQLCGKYEVTGFGIFTSNEGGEVSFLADENFDFAPDSFSLEAIALEVNDDIEEKSGEEQVDEPEVTLVKEQVKEQVEEKKADVPMSMEKKRKIQKWMVWIAVAVILLLVLVLFVVLFKEDFMELVKRLLYSREELEIMQKWAAQ